MIRTQSYSISDPVAITGYQVTTFRVSGYKNVTCLGNESDVTDCSFGQTGLFPSCSFAGVNCSDFGKCYYDASACMLYYKVYTGSGYCTSDNWCSFFLECGGYLLSMLYD